MGAELVFRRHWGEPAVTKMDGKDDGIQKPVDPAERIAETK